MSADHCHGHAVIDNRLQLAGQPLSRIAAVVGRTPFFAYDRNRIRARVAELRSLLPSNWQLHYAVKANPLPALVQLLAGLVDGLDIASAGELRIALDSGVAAQRIGFAGPGKRDAEIAQAVAAGVVLNIESERELRVVADCAQRFGVRPPVALRINPDFAMDGAAAQMAGGARQFGVDAEAAGALLRSMATMAVEFVGFHLYFGSQNLDADAIARSQQRAVTLAARLAEAAPAPVRLLNLGGGFGIAHFDGDRPLDLPALSRHMHSLNRRIADLLPQATPMLELGRYLVGEAGVYVCSIVDRKVSRGQTFLVTDGGLHHHLSASGQLGPPPGARRNHPIVVVDRVAASAGEALETVNVVGPLCLALDRLGDQVDLPRAEIGDLLAVLASGAYGPSASPLGFLGHPAPGEALV